jgi:eukaryotic-like serine/threonine-protein kinase
MGEVYRATDLRTGETVAIKLLKHSARQVHRARFQREIRALAEIRHPGVVRYVGHGEWTDRRLFLVMEWLEGQDLGVALERSEFGLGDAVELVRRAAHAMIPVHARGIVHRDLKPSNLFLLSGGDGLCVKLIDFGLVKRDDPDLEPTQRGLLLGTPWFIAPEQARGQNVDARADVYSLGAVLFRLVTGRHLFETPHLIAYLGRLVLEEAPRACSIRREVPEALDELLARTLRREPAQRPADSAELEQLLGALPELGNSVPSSRPSIMPAAPAAQQPGLVGLTRRLQDAIGQPTPGAVSPALLERRVVAVVLAELEHRPVAELLTREVRTVAGEQARVEMLQGEQVVVGFGLDRLVGDEAIRAARVALRLVRVFPGTRAAVAAGHAVTGRRGLAGEALERAAKQLARVVEPGIRVDEDIQPLLKGRFVTLDDDAGGVLVCEQEVDAEPRRVLGRATPMVGRSRELALAVSVFDAVARDRIPRAVLLLGPEGIGKSRLRREVMCYLRDKRAHPDALVAHGDPVRAHRGVSSFGLALRARMGIHEGQDAQSQALRMRQFLQQHRSCDPVGLAEFVGELVGVSDTREVSRELQTARATPVLMAARIFHAVEGLLRCDAPSAPQVVVLEDVEHLDETTVALADWLLDCEDLPLMVLAQARSDFDQRFPDLWKRRRVTMVPLAPLCKSASELLVHNCLPNVDSSTLRRIVRRAQGNPLFLEELIRHETKTRGKLPLSVHALIQARLDQRTDSQRQLVRAVSVFGLHFWTGSAEALLERDCGADLEQLQAAEIFVREEPSRFAGQPQWAFQHTLVFETAYASLLPEDRTALHARAAQWLQEAGEQDLGLIARHVDAGGDLARAAALYAKASTQAYSKGQLRAALEFATRGATTAEDQPLRAACLLQRAQILSWMGRYEDQLQAARAASGSCEAGTDAWGEAKRLIGSAQREAGRSHEAEMLLAFTLEQGATVHLSPATRSRLHAEWARTLIDLARPEAARRAADLAVQAATEAGEAGTNAMIRALDARSMTVGISGDYSGAVDAAQAVVQQAESVGEALLATRARINLGFALNRVGCFDLAREALERALRDARALRMRVGEGFATHNLARTLGHTSELDRAVQLQEAARRIGEETGHYRLTLLSTVYEALMRAKRAGRGDLDLALQRIEQARAVAQLQPLAEIETLAVHGAVLQATGAISEALELTHEALQRFAACQVMEDGEEALRLQQVELLIQLGRGGEADDALRDAHGQIVSRFQTLRHPQHRAGYISHLPACQRILFLAALRLALTEPYRQDQT